MPQQVDFFFDFVSPYTYLAQTQLPDLKTRSSATFRLWPMHLLKLMKSVGNVPTPCLPWTPENSTRATSGPDQAR